MKWEYKVLILEFTYPPSGPEQEFNRLGEEGWELCGLKLESNRWTVIFKRFRVEDVVNKIV